ncbi:MAG: hypothetical protein V4614_05625 [Pseudomonadota bacterium]
MSSSSAAMTSASFMSAPNFLRNVLRLDALSCLACGALQLAVPGTLTQLMKLPQPLVVFTGVFLLLYAALVAFISTRRPLPRKAIAVLVAGNLGWAVACVALLLSGEINPSGLGVAYVLTQAVTVALLAELQFLGLRRAAAQPAW